MNHSPDFKVFYNIFREISTLVHASTRVQEILEMVVWKSTQLIGAKGAFLWTLNLDEQRPDLSASYGLGEKYLIKEPVSKLEIITEVCRANKLIVIEDIIKNPRVRYGQELWDEGVRMVLDIPLVITEGVLGMMRLCFGEKKKFSHDELDLFLAVAEVSACAIDKARLVEEQESRYDHLALQTEKLSALGRMSAGIAHEINNPLAGILLFSTNIRKKVPEEGPVKNGLDVIIREAMRCKGIIQDLLAFSRDREPKKVSANINTIIDQTLSLLENEFHLHHISLEKNLESEIPNIFLDLNLMQQVFVNILMNAVQAMDENGVITILSNMSQDQKNVKIEIADTGRGIPPDDMEKVFEPFFSTKENGTGLGLAVSYGIIKKHQGDIQIFSEPGRGTRFTIDMPVE